MRQQINLYERALGGPRKPASALTVTTTLAVVVVGLAGLSVHANVRVGHLGRQLEMLRQQQAQQEAQLARVAQLQASSGTSAEIAARVQQLETAVSERARALKVLQSGAAGQTVGFADRLEALARRHVAGLWIDSLVMSGTNGAMSLSGGSVNPDIVAAYLRSLAREPVLTGTRFDDFVIRRPEAGSAAADDETAQKLALAKRNVAVEHVRFHAGSKALADKRAEVPI